MIVRNLHIIGIAVAPNEADSPLVVDTNAVLAAPTAEEFCETVCGRNPQVLQRLRPVQHAQFAKRGALYLDGQTLRVSSMEDRFCLSVSETPYHCIKCIT